jgi:hypothetical protein
VRQCASVHASDFAALHVALSTALCLLKRALPTDELSVPIAARPAATAHRAPTVRRSFVKRMMRIRRHRSAPRDTVARVRPSHAADCARAIQPLPLSNPR